MELQAFMKTLLHAFYCCCFLVHSLLKYKFWILKKNKPLFFWRWCCFMCEKKRIFAPKSNY